MLPTFPKASVPTQEQFADVLKWMKDKGMVSADVPYANLVTRHSCPSRNPEFGMDLVAAPVNR